MWGGWPTLEISPATSSPFPVQRRGWTYKISSLERLGLVSGEHRTAGLTATGKNSSSRSPTTSTSQSLANVLTTRSGRVVVRVFYWEPFYFQTRTNEAEDDVNKYYFYFAFENSKCKDYISEKVFRALQVIIWSILNFGNWVKFGNSPSNFRFFESFKGYLKW